MVPLCIHHYKHCNRCYFIQRKINILYVTSISIRSGGKHCPKVGEHLFWVLEGHRNSSVTWGCQGGMATSTRPCSIAAFSSIVVVVTVPAIFIIAAEQDGKAESCPWNGFQPPQANHYDPISLTSKHINHVFHRPIEFWRERPLLLSIRVNSLPSSDIIFVNFFTPAQF